MPQPPFSRTISEGSGDGSGLKVEGTSSRPFGLDFLQDVISVSWGSLGFLVFSETVAGLASNDGSNWVSVTYPIPAVCGVFGDGRWIITDGKSTTGAVSTDTGKTWKPISFPTPFKFLAYIKPDKKAKKGIFAGTDIKFPYISTDSGATWQQGPDLSSSSNFFDQFDLFLMGGGNVFIINGGAFGVIAPGIFSGGGGSADEDVIPLPFTFPVYRNGWGSGSGFSSIDPNLLANDPEGEPISVESFTAAYDSETEQYKVWAIARADGEALRSATSSDGRDFSASTLEYTPGIVINSSGQSVPLGFIDGSSWAAAGNGIFMVPMVKAILDDPEDTGGGAEISQQTSGVVIDGEFDATPGQTAHSTDLDTKFLTVGGAAFCKNANNGAGLFAVGFSSPAGSIISVSAEGSGWEKNEVPVKPLVIVVGDVSGFLAIGEPIA